MKLYQPLLLLFVLTLASSAPVETSDRKAKNLPFFDYIQPEMVDYNNYDSDYILGLEENDLGRTLPGRRRPKPRPQYNSPIYYIRLPPQPYMYYPGLGYMSQPPQNPMSQFVNVPVSFISNGKPNGIYQWTGAMDTFPAPTELPPKPTKKPIPDSNIHRLPGQYVFNGKPEDIFVLRDSYNSLYGDALQNFYP
ncbi:uncharacterized protein LOC109601850 [Aethina tumida]|uniref:uncharacterized protein LOC109601850 n=1 Tax=Aethina tumida TaxID=116153 RepID=UPI00096B2CD3|nr:uncharacterized protein LOC109601850 [Aethina tumida]